jgi:hypothetical protein
MPKPGSVCLLIKSGRCTPSVREHSRKYAARLVLEQGVSARIALRLAMLAVLAVTGRDIADADLPAVAWDHVIGVAQEAGLLPAGGAA